MEIFKILVIEDDQDILEVLAYVLSEDGYEVVTSNDGAVLSSIATIKPHLIFLDERLSSESGSDLCRKLKAEINTASIPVVMISAHKDVEMLAKMAGADSYISKPFNIAEIGTVAGRFLKN